MNARAFGVVAIALALMAAGCLDGVDQPLEDADDPGPQGPATGEGSGQDGNSSGQAESDDGSGTSNGSSDGEDGSGASRSNSTSRSYPPWPEVSEASVRPGVQVTSDTGQCTSNFLFRTPDNASLFLGVAAHCFAENPNGGGDGCDPVKEPLAPGAQARISGAPHAGTLVYSSWYSMQTTNESSGDACRYNDFALVELDPADRSQVHPAMLTFGGPTGTAGGATMGEKVLWYGNSGTRPSTEAAHENEGYVVSSQQRTAIVYSASPGVPGDSGSGVITADGEALGALVTLNGFPPGSNGVTLLGPALSYAEEQGIEVELVTWQQQDEGRLPG